MKLVCPSCGATASAESWTNDAAIRYTIEALIQLPGPVLRVSLAYMGLFRQGTKALPWRRALTIARSLRELVETNTVHWQGGETRPCNASIWAQAMEATLTSNPTGLRNHNYLRKTAWEMSAGLAAQAENAREEKRRNIQRDGTDAPEELSPATRQKIEAMKKHLGVK